MTKKEQVELLSRTLPVQKEIINASKDEKYHKAFLLSFYRLDDVVIRRYYFRGIEAIREIDTDEFKTYKVTYGIQKAMYEHCFLNGKNKWKLGSQSFQYYLCYDCYLFVRDFKFNNPYININNLDHINVRGDISHNCFDVYPEIEYLSKIGYKPLIEYLLYNCMEVTKSEAKVFIDNNLTYDEIIVYYEIVALNNGSNKKVNVDIVKKIASISTWHTHIDELYTRALKKLTIKQFLEYDKLNRNNIQYYCDYLRMLIEMRLNVNAKILMPKQIKSAHNKLLIRYNEYKDMLEAESNKKKEKKLKKIQKELESKLSQLETDHLKIVFPKTLNEFEKEGKELEHCIKSYFTKVANGYTNVVFIRNKKDINKPLYTMEINNNSIRQYYGKNNTKPIDKEALAIKKMIQNKLNQEAYLCNN